MPFHQFLRTTSTGKEFLKFEETIDITDLDRIRERLKKDRAESDHLQSFEVVKKSDISQLCPNFEFGSKFVDDIYDAKFHGERYQSYRVIVADVFVKMNVLIFKSLCSQEVVHLLGSRERH